MKLIGNFIIALVLAFAQFANACTEGAAYRSLLSQEFNDIYSGDAGFTLSLTLVNFMSRLGLLEVCDNNTSFCVLLGQVYYEGPREDSVKVAWNPDLGEAYVVALTPGISSKNVIFGVARTSGTHNGLGQVLTARSSGYPAVSFNRETDKIMVTYRGRNTTGMYYATRDVSSTGGLGAWQGNRNFETGGESQLGPRQLCAVGDGFISHHNGNNNVNTCYETNYDENQLRWVRESTPCYVYPEGGGFTGWLNRDGPGGTGDWELHSAFLSQRPPVVCSNPSQIYANRIGGGFIIYTPGMTLPDVVAAFNEEVGLICRNSDQTDGRCSDYQVQFLCE